MKTSNKILLSLLALVIIGIFAVNLILKNQMDKRVKEPSIPAPAITQPSEEADSIAMEEALENE